MKKMTEFLNKIFAPRTTIYYNDKEVDELPKNAKETFKQMDKIFKQMNEIFKSFEKMF